MPKATTAPKPSKADLKAQARAKFLAEERQKPAASHPWKAGDAQAADTPGQARANVDVRRAMLAELCEPCRVAVLEIAASTEEIVDMACTACFHKLEAKNLAGGG